MKINRNTINADISYWYSKIIRRDKIFDPEQRILVILERMDLQRSRLVEILHGKITLQEKIQIEKMILEVDYKIASIQQKLAESSRRVFDLAVNHANKMIATTSDKRYMTLFDRFRVSQKSYEKISKIIHEDKGRSG